MPKCKHCKQPATLKIQMANFCSVDCAYKHARKLQEQARKRKELKAKREHAKRKESLKSRSEWLKEAQAEFNKFIRLRDADLPCISCGKSEGEIANGDGFLTGGMWDAGHYLTVGAFPELRFTEENCHRQCKRCNAGAGRFSSKSRTVQEKYRVNLVKRIGLDKVDWLEGKHEPLKLTIEQIKEIKITYREKCKQLVGVVKHKN